MLLPLFPLHKVLFPGGKVELQLFEPRYLRLLSESLKLDHPFVVSLIVNGQETLQPGVGLPEVESLGCSAQIIDWNMQDNGLLLVSIEGVELARVGELQVESDQLIKADIELINSPLFEPVPEEFSELVYITRQLLQHPEQQVKDYQLDFSSAEYLGCRLAEALPVTESKKQQWLAMPTLQRLQALQDQIEDLQV